MVALETFVIKKDYVGLCEIISFREKKASILVKICIHAMWFFWIYAKC